MKMEVGYGEILVVVHAICFVLAHGAYCPDLISADLVDAASLPIVRHCRGRGTGFDRHNNRAPRPPLAQNLNTVFIPRIHLKS
jgi:hypothetical protein